MFDSKNLTGRLTDAVDLLIDFATLGEYGLEPAPQPPRRRCEGTPLRGPRRGRERVRPATYSVAGR